MIEDEVARNFIIHCKHVQICTVHSFDEVEKNMCHGYNGSTLAVLQATSICHLFLYFAQVQGKVSTKTGASQ